MRNRICHLAALLAALCLSACGNIKVSVSFDEDEDEKQEATTIKDAPAVAKQEHGKQRRPDPEKPKPSPDAFAEVKIKDGTFAPFKVGEKLVGDRDRTWIKISSEFENMRFSFRKSNWNQHADFEVVTDGWVYLAISTRATGYEKAGGDLMDLTPTFDIVKDGWRQLRVSAPLIGGSLEYLVYERFCRQGEKFVYRTERYSSPVVLLGEQRKPSGTERIAGWAQFTDRGGMLKALQPKQSMFLHKSKNEWKKIPGRLKGMYFTYRNDGHTADFEILSDGLVWLAISRDAEAYNKPSSKYPDLTPLSEIIKQGWKRVKLEPVVGAGQEWYVYERFCEKGEAFSYRTERSTAPILFTM